jgi:ribonuclease VapC
MIAVDTSALMAILLSGREAAACAAALEAEPHVLISAGTMAEALIVAGRRNLLEEMQTVIEDLAFEVVSVTPAAALRIGAAYARWGKGAHPAGLNFGDCFAYEAATEHACPLLYVGNGFSQTDVASAL